MSTLVTGGTVVCGDGEIVPRGEVEIEGSRIVRVSDVRSGSRGHDRVIDASGRFVLPGLIDTHVHFGGGDYDPMWESVPIGLQALRSLEAAQRSLLAGVTTVRSAGAQSHLDVDVRDAIGAGVAWGPRVLASGRGITHTGGHGREFAIEADGAVEVRKAVRSLVGRGVDSIKLFGVSAGVSTGGADVGAEGFAVEEIAAAVDEAARLHRLVQVHSIGLQATKNAVAAGVPAIDHGHFLDEETCSAMVAKGICLVPTFGPTYYYTEKRIAEPWRIARSDQVRPAHIESFRLALKTGVRIVMGSDLGFASRMKNGENALELEQMVKHGMGPEDAIYSATQRAAELLGLAGHIGSLRPGKLADLILVDGDPLNDIAVLSTRVCLVMREGVVYRDDNSGLDLRRFRWDAAALADSLDS